MDSKICKRFTMESSGGSDQTCTNWEKLASYAQVLTTINSILVLFYHVLRNQRYQYEPASAPHVSDNKTYMFYH